MSAHRQDLKKYPIEHKLYQQITHISIQLFDKYKYFTTQKNGLKFYFGTPQNYTLLN